MVTMDIRQIRYLVSAIEGGALSAAAKKQFVTVQAVSKAIFSERGLESPILETRSPSRSVPEELRTRQAYLFAVYLKFFGDGSRGYRAIPLDERDAAQIPLCLVTLKDSKSQAYQTFAASVNESLRLDALL